MTPETAIFPATYLAAVERQIQTVLGEMTKKANIPRCILVLVGDQGNIRSRANLRTDPAWIFNTCRIEDGLIGKALRTPSLLFAERGEFEQGDPRTEFEVALSVSYDNLPTGVILVDYFKDEMSTYHPNSPESQKKLSVNLALLRQEIESVFLNLENRANFLEQSIRAATSACVSETNSTRGYTAFKRWDGTLKYITHGEGREKFLYLGQLEGICGTAMDSGEIQNLDDVWRNENYTPSDKQIKSELVAPIFDGGEAIGVVNLESVRPKNYDKSAERLVVEAAGVVEPLCKEYRETLRPEIGAHSRMLSDFIEQVGAWSKIIKRDHSIEHDFAELITIFKRKVLSLANTISIDVLRKDSTEMASENGNYILADDYPVEPRTERSSSGLISHHSIDQNGVFHYSIAVLHRESLEVGSKLETIEQLCRITISEMRRRLIERQNIIFEDVFMGIIGGTIAQINVSLLHSIREILGCDDVTFFRARNGGDRWVLSPSITTATRVGFNNRSENVYYVDEEDGLTGFASTRDSPIVIHNVHNASELKKIHSKIRWKKVAYESHDSKDVRSFFAFAIWHDGEIKGLLRGHRGRFRASTFSKRDILRVGAIQKLLGEII
ncbi:MAG: GAF domain-containing protein [Roseobacter sp.]